MIDLATLIRSSFTHSSRVWGLARAEPFRPDLPGVFPLELKVNTNAGEIIYSLGDLDGRGGWLLQNGRKLLVNDMNDTHGWDLAYLACLMELVEALGDPGHFHPTVYYPEKPAPLLIYFHNYVGVIAEAYFKKKERRYPLVIERFEESPTWPYVLALTDKTGNILHRWPFRTKDILGVGFDE